MRTSIIFITCLFSASLASAADKIQSINKEIVVNVKESEIELKITCDKQMATEEMPSRLYHIIGNGVAELAITGQETQKSYISPHQYGQIVDSMLGSGFAILPEKIPEYSAAEYSGKIFISELNSRLIKACYFSLKLRAGNYVKEIKFSKAYRGFNDPIAKINNIFKAIPASAEHAR